MEKELLELKFKRDIAKRGRVTRTLLAFDQLCNVIFWNGSQDQTISSHINTRQTEGRANWFDNLVCKVLNKIESSHCFKASGE